MAAQVTEVLNAANMPLTLFCGGLSYAGFNLSGTWTGVVQFNVSNDAVNFRPSSVIPFASGTPVQTATANGSWFAQILGFQAVQLIPTTLSTGSVVAKIFASQDMSFQDSFLATTSRFLNSQASGAVNTLTVPANTNRSWRLRTLVVSVDSTATWATKPVVQISDGASSLLWAMDLTTAAQLTNIPLPLDYEYPTGSFGGLVTTPGNSLVITVASGGGSVKTNICAEVLAA